MGFITAKQAHEESKANEKNFLNDTIKHIHDAIQKSCKRGIYKIKFPVTFKINYDSDIDCEFECQRDRYIEDMNKIYKLLNENGYSVSMNVSTGENQIPKYADDYNGNEYVSGHTTEVTYLYELIIGW